MSIRIAASAGLAALLALPAAASAQALVEKNISLAMAQALAQAASTACTPRASIAVLDRTGRMKVFLQGDNASPINIELARRKAYTSLSFRRTSIEWAKRTETATQGQRALTDVIPLQGGVPIMIGEEIIGAVGISGAPNGGEQEEACGKTGIENIKDMLK